MNNLIKLALGIATIVMLSGCGNSTLDTSSDEAMKDSVQKIMAELSESDQERFKETLTGIYVVGSLANLGSDNTEEEVIAEINAKLNGKTAEEIFQFAEELKQIINNE